MTNDSKEKSCVQCSNCTCSHAVSDSRSEGRIAYQKLRREVAAARLRVSIAKRRKREISPKVLALADLRLPPTLDCL